MKINYLPQYNYNISFGTSAREYDNQCKNTISGNKIYTTTTLFREDLDFDKLADYIIEGFKDKDKVDIKCLAGSDGSEAYSLAISIMEKVPKSEYKKYFPITSIDKDEEITQSAQEGKINLSKCDIKKLKKVTDKEYFIKKGSAYKLNSNYIEEKLHNCYEPVPELRNAVQFKKGDLFQEINNIKDNSNSVILCRNVLPYLHKSATSFITYGVHKKLNKNSLFIVGKFDTKNTDIRTSLLFADFNEVQNNVFKRN